MRKQLQKLKTGAMNAKDWVDGTIELALYRWCSEKFLDTLEGL